MAGYDFEKMKKKLEKYLDGDRYLHTLGVMYTCAAMAMAYGCSLDEAQAAGLLHDCAKCIPNKKKIKMCQDAGISITPFEEAHPFLLHGKLGAYVAGEKYHVKNQEVLSSITWHTTGKPDMTVLEKIVYIADYIEPGRDKAPNLTPIREMAFRDLDECMYMILKDTLNYLGENPEDIDSVTKDAFDFYENVHLKKASDIRKENNG